MSWSRSLELIVQVDIHQSGAPESAMARATPARTCRDKARACCFGVLGFVILELNVQALLDANLSEQSSV